MKTHLDCTACFIRQTIEAVRMATNDTQVQEKVVRDVLTMAGKMDMSQSPPAMARHIHRIIKAETGCDDLYSDAKLLFNDFAMRLYPKFRQKVLDAADPLEAAVRLAISGNIIDLGVKSSLSIDQAQEVIANTLNEHFETTDLEEFRNRCENASKVLYLCDNSGEIVFDKILIELIGPEKVTAVVRGRPIINDATLEDASYVGLADMVEVIDNGDDSPGTVLEWCSEELLARFNDADVVIAKGQGNFETLSEAGRDIFFLLKAKCHVIAEHINRPIGTMVLRYSPTNN